VIHSGIEAWGEAMMGERQIDQAALFYEFSPERHVPTDHMLRAIDRFVDLESVRAHLAAFYSSRSRPSVDPELLIRMLIVGYCFGIRSERRLCEEDLARNIAKTAAYLTSRRQCKKVEMCFAHFKHILKLPTTTTRPMWRT
jgi:hypothetical protein